LRSEQAGSCSHAIDTSLLGRQAVETDERQERLGLYMALVAGTLKPTHSLAAADRNARSLKITPTNTIFCLSEARARGPRE